LSWQLLTFFTGQAVRVALQGSGTCAYRLAKERKQTKNGFLNQVMVGEG
jgi:hypothetical protein